MDGSRFDTLVKALANTPLTRSHALRGIAAGGVAALTGIILGSEEAGAKKNHEHKVKVCKCPDSNAANCRTDKVNKSQAKKQARKACNYKGTCRAGVTGCPTGAPNPGFACTNNNDCTGGLVCIGQRCVACTADSQCTGGLVCLSGTCQTLRAGSGPACVTNIDCPVGLVCIRQECTACTADFQCGSGRICLNGTCQDPTVFTCFSGITGQCLITDPQGCPPECICGALVGGGNLCFRPFGSGGALCSTIECTNDTTCIQTFGIGSICVTDACCGVAPPGRCVPASFLCRA